jgi:hypothetical protein
LNDNRFLRLLVVACLVTWSPGSWWCCCGAHADAPESDVAADSHATSCCSERGVTAPTAVTAADECCPVNSDEAPSCGCLHGAANAALPAVATVPPADNGDGPDLDLLAELPPALAGAATMGRHHSPCRGSPQPIPARTLLSLGCLLTT